MAKQRTNWKEKYQESQKELENLKGFQDALKSQEFVTVFQKKIIKIERIHVVVAFCLVVLTAMQVYSVIRQNEMFNNQNILFENQNKLFTKQIILDSTQTYLLENQNSKLDLQNRLFAYQLIFDSVQTNLFENQTIQLDMQNILLANQTLLDSQQLELYKTQNLMILKQNELISNQNFKIDKQNEITNVQSHLLESNRRSSLVFLMSNVLDLINEEIKEQEKIGFLGSNKSEDYKTYPISNQLLGRIIALSKSFEPYQILINNELSKEKLSPERGQLFISLINSPLDELSQKYIYEEGDFSNSKVGKVIVENQYLYGVKLSNSIFSDPIDEDGYYGDESSYNYHNQKQSEFKNVVMTNSKLASMNLFNSRLIHVLAMSSSLNNAILSYSYCYDVLFNTSSMNSIDLNKSKFKKCDFGKVEMKKAKIYGAIFQETSFRGADLTGITIKSNHKNHILTNPGIIPCEIAWWSTRFQDVDLRDASLCYSELTHATINDADFRGAILYEANLDSACIEGSNFGINLNHNSDDLFRHGCYYECSKKYAIRLLDINTSSYARTILINANFRNSLLTDVNMTGAMLFGTKFDNATIVGVDFKESLGLTKEQLLEAKSLYQCKNLPDSIVQFLKKEKPCLFTRKGCSDE